MIHMNPTELASRLVDQMLPVCPGCGRPLDALLLCPDAKDDDVRQGWAFCRGAEISHPDECGCERCHNTRLIVAYPSK
jgi:hypothetical protein